jgi:hypothetical protein
MSQTSFRYTRPSDRITAGSWTVATGSARSGYPVTNLDNGDPSDPFWANETTVRATRDFGTATRVDEVYIFGHNLDSTSALHVQMNATASWGGPTVDITASIPTAHLDGIPYAIRVDLAAAVSVANRTQQFLSIVNQSANSVSIAIGEVYMVGTQRELGRHVRYGFSQPRNRIVVNQPSKRGVSTRYDLGTVERKLIASIPGNDADYLDLLKLEEDGKSGLLPFVIVLAPQSPTVRWAEPLMVRQAAPISDAPYDHPAVFPVNFILDVLGEGELVSA